MAETVDGYVCTECDHAQIEEPDSPLYECCSTYNRENSNDGESNRCPSCNKFGARIADYACPECQGEMETGTVFVCKCGTQYPNEDLAGACAKEDAIPQSVKDKRKAEKDAEREAEYAEWRRQDIERLTGITLISVVEAIDQHGDHMLFHDSNWTSKMGVMLHPHIAVELRCLVVDELERRHKEEADA